MPEGGVRYVDAGVDAHKQALCCSECLPTVLLPAAQLRSLPAPTCKERAACNPGVPTLQLWCSGLAAHPPVSCPEAFRGTPSLMRGGG